MRMLSCVLHNKPLCAPGLSPEQWAELLETAKRHKVANTLAYVLPLLQEGCTPPAEICQQLDGILLQETLVGSNQLFAAQELRHAFEQAGIHNLMVKGCRTKLHYPKDGMRSMGDLDVLCKPEQNAAVKDTMEGLGYGEFQEGRKHDHYTRKPFVTVEMHRELVPADSRFRAYYAGVWNRCQPLPGCVYSCAMTPEDEYIFHLVHMVGHFKEGGVGIRFVMDVYAYEYFVELDRVYLRRELEKLSLWDFYCNIKRLAQLWFAPEEQAADDLTERLGEFILSGGVYGTAENASDLAVSRDGRLGFVVRTCFPSYREMCSMFPWLRNRPVLLPYSWVLRGVRSLRYRKANVRSQIRVYKNADADRGRALRAFYRECGLEDL